MEPVRPEFLPDASLTRREMESLQQQIAEAAIFEDAVPADTLVETLQSGKAGTATGNDDPVIAGVDQGFSDEMAYSAIVTMQDGEVVDRVHATKAVEIPYIPGLLAFREGGAVLAAFDRLETVPDVVLFDGSGRIHYREAGLATHIGVILDRPTIGVIKNLLCGSPRQSLDAPLQEGTRIPIEADGQMTTPDGTVVGYALQTRQYDSGNRHINPVYVSPGHRVGAETATTIVEAQASEYKLPEPIRRADQYAGELVG